MRYSKWFVNFRPFFFLFKLCFDEKNLSKEIQCEFAQLYAATYTRHKKKTNVYTIFSLIFYARYFNEIYRKFPFYNKSLCDKMPQIRRKMPTNDLFIALVLKRVAVVFILRTVKRARSDNQIRITNYEM